MMAGAGSSVGGAGMLRARRRDVSVKPNRKLDRKSSRGMIYENEELRLRTIHINAEVEQGQNDIKKLRRENEQLRREIWSLRDEYDKLEEILKRQKSRGESEEYEDRSEEDDGLQSDYSCEEEEQFEEEMNGKRDVKDLNKEEQLENVENQKISSEKMTTNSLHRLHVDFDDLSVVDEEEELKKDKERKEASSENSQQLKEDPRSPSAFLRPRQLHENIPFYPATYEPANSFASSTYYDECPFEFPSTVDLMLPADTTGLLSSPYSRLRADPLIPIGNFNPTGLEQQVNDQMLPQLHVPPVGWQSNVVYPQKQLSTYPTANVTSATIAPTEVEMFAATDARVRQESLLEQQQFTLGSSFSNFPTLSQNMNVHVKQPVNVFDAKTFEDSQTSHTCTDHFVTDNGWTFPTNISVDRNNTYDGKEEHNLNRNEERNVEGIFTLGSEKPKHFFAPLPSKVKKQTDEGSPTNESSHFGTGNSSSSGKTGSTVISKSQFTSQKGSADIYVNGAVPCEGNVQRNREEQRTFLSTDNLLIVEDKSMGINQLMKSMSCQDLTSDSQNAAISEQFRINHGDGRQQMLTQSDNTLDSIMSDGSSRPYKSHLTVTLKTPRVNQEVSPGTPEIPKLPSMDYRIFNNPFLRTFEQTCRPSANQNTPITRPLSVEVNDDNVCYRYPTPSNANVFGRGGHREERYRTHVQPDQNRLLMPSNQLLNGKMLSPLNKHEIQVTSFERPSPHTLIPPSTPYDLNTLRRISKNAYMQNRNLYQNIPFIPRGPAHLYPQRGPMRMYYDNPAIKVPAQTQTSIDGDSHHGDDHGLSHRHEEVIGTTSSPSGQQRKKVTKREKTNSKDPKPLSPAAQRRLKKQTSVTSSEAPESPSKIARKRPRKLSVTTTTTTSEVQEDKNESRSSSSGQDSPRKDQTRRVSLYFNTKKRPSLTSLKTARSSSIDTTKDKYADGVTNSERDRTNSISSRETTSVKARKASTSSGNVPWCACWGNGCI